MQRDDIMQEPSSGGEKKKKTIRKEQGKMAIENLAHRSQSTNLTCISLQKVAS